MAIPRLMVALANAAASSSSSLPQRPLSPRDLYHAVWASRRAGQVEAERGDQGFGPRLLVSLAPAFGTVDPSAFLSGPRLDAHELSSIAESYWPRANKEEEQGAGMDIGMRCELEAAAPAVLMALEACVRDEMAAEGFSAQEERILRLAYLQCCGRELPGRPRHMEVKLGDAAGREVAESGDAGLDGDVEAKAEKEGQRPLLRGKKPEVLRKPVPARAVQ